MSKEATLAKIIVCAYFNNRPWKLFLEAIAEEDKQTILKGLTEIGERLQNGRTA